MNSDKINAPTDKLTGATNFSLSDESLSIFNNSSATHSLKEFSSRHSLHGSIQVHGDRLFLLVKPFLANPKQSPAEDFHVLAYGWDGEFGSCLTFTILKRGSEKSRYVARAFVSIADPLFQSLKTKQLYFAFVVNHAVVRILKLNCLNERQSKEYFRAFEVAESNVPEYLQVDLSYWLLFEQVSQWKQLLLPKDYLSLGWARHLAAELRMLLTISSHEKSRLEYEENSAFFDSLPPFPRSVFQSAMNSGIDAALAAFGKGMNDAMFMSEMIEAHEKLLEKDLTYIAPLTSQVFQVFRSLPIIIGFGTRVSWVQGYPTKIKTTEIDETDWTEEQRENYWANLDRSSMVDRNQYLDPDDFPTSPADEEKSWEKLKLGCPTSEAEGMISALLEEASASRKWIIPPRALVSISIGDFTHVELTEVRDEVYCVFRDDQYRHFVVSVNPTRGAWAVTLRRKNENDSEANEIVVALKLLLSALIRDFWVVEERREVFDRTEKSGRFAQQLQKRQEGPVIVYLPRIRYNSAPNIENCSSQLEIEQRRKHFVRAHLRKSAKASSAQLRLASIYGLPVIEGFTFVRPHERGDVKRETIYRSRSALKLLYNESVTRHRNTLKPHWFEFECDVRKLLEENDFDIQSVSSPGRGDLGVDILANRKTKTGIQIWVVQCKCYSSRAVGPAAVRELIGTVSRYGDEAKGMLVTTSTFSPGAVSAAKGTVIDLIDGSAFYGAISGKSRIAFPK